MNYELSFPGGTPERVQDIITSAAGTPRRLRLFLGDAETGEDWIEENGTIGRIGVSTGRVKIPLLCPRADSIGGGAILTRCVVKITEDKRTLYTHPAYHQKAIYADGKQVYTGETLYANCNTEDAAKRLAAFLRGERNSK